ncbi:cell division cycle- protein [Gaertneriomyces sp. JEL0708]|nr:cell division cycle- protein [Gaertneriomyces sp. JEL0708]
MRRTQSCSAVGSDKDTTFNLTTDPELDSALLPWFPGRSDSHKRISGETLAHLLDGDFDDKVDEYYILDCRFPYEFSGGHIATARNINTKSELLDLFFKPPRSEKNVVVVFHCEFSSHRAPRMASFMRKYDRQLNIETYPNLHYPEIYVLEGGYRKFYSEFKPPVMRRTNSEIIAISTGGWPQPKQPGKLRASLETLERTRSEGSFVTLERSNEQSRSSDKLRRSISDTADLYPGFASPFARAGGKQLGVFEKPHRDTSAKSRKHESRRKKARHVSNAKPAADPSLVDSIPVKVVKRNSTRRNRGDVTYVPLNDVSSENFQTLPEVKRERTTRSNRRRRPSGREGALPSTSTAAAQKQNVRHEPTNELASSKEKLPTPPHREGFNPLLAEQDVEKSKTSPSRTATVRWEFPPQEDVNTAHDAVRSKTMRSITGNQKESEIELDADILRKSHVAVHSSRDTIRESITSKPARPWDSLISPKASNASDQEKLHEGTLKQQCVEGLSTSVLVVKVLSSSWLPPNMRVTQPVVLGHLLDGVQGVYLKDDAKVLKTKPYDLISHGTLVPHWNEELIFPIGEASALDPNSILLFEVSGQDASLPVASVLG